MIVALLVLESIVPVVSAIVFVAERAVALRAFGLFPMLLAIGIWTGRRLAQVVARGLAGVHVLVATGIMVFAFFDSTAPFVIARSWYPIPRTAGLCAMVVLALSSWWQWRLLGRDDVVAEFARASW